MYEISTNLIKEAVYNLCFNANICLNESIYNKIFEAYNNTLNIEEKNYLKSILKNAKIAFDEKIPLCQDTGQVLVFLEIGQKISLTDGFIIDAVNSAVKQCYCENFFRKSIVSNAIFNRTNTKTNTPCIIYSKYTNCDDVKIKVLIKGAGSENKSQLNMLLPTLNQDEIIKNCTDLILKAGVNACPPMFIGIGIGGTADLALLNSKEALLQDNFTVNELNFAEKLKENINKSAPLNFKDIFVLDVKLKSHPTHIACMPVGITINCHSDRFSSAVINENGIVYNHKIPDFINFNDEINEYREINTNDIEKLKSLTPGENILLTGELYIARDMAHKRMIDLLKENKPLPFDINNKIIFYAGPCPNSKDKIISSVGPTTSERMDKYAIDLYKRGLFATIGKGERSQEIINYLKKNDKKYFTAQGGIAALLSKKVTKSEIIAFEDLGPEAIYKIEVEKFPVKLAY